MTQMGENPKPLQHTREYFHKAISSGEPIGIVKPSKQWTDELLDWGKKLDLERPRKLVENPGYEWLRKSNAQGPLMGGCITSIMHLRGTEYWPDYKGKILFWEIPEGQDFSKGEPLVCVDAHLADLKLSGVFDQIKGMIVGRPFQYTQDQAQSLRKKILERTEGYKFPILYGADIGHSDPQITVPLGVEARIDSKSDRFEILEAGTR